MSSYKKPTQAQRELLVWMRKDEGDVPRVFRGGTLIEYYQQKAVKNGYPRKRGGYASHGWRRAGGTALKRLADAGYLIFQGFSIGVPEYVLSDVGIAWADYFIALDQENDLTAG